MNRIIDNELVDRINNFYNPNNDTTMNNIEINTINKYLAFFKQFKYLVDKELPIVLEKMIKDFKINHHIVRSAESVGLVKKISKGKYKILVTEFEPYHMRKIIEFTNKYQRENSKKINMKKMGIEEIRNNREKYKNEFMKLFDKGWSITRIAKKYKTYYSNVKKVLDWSDIKTITNLDANEQPSHSEDEFKNNKELENKISELECERDRFQRLNDAILKDYNDIKESYKQQIDEYLAENNLLKEESKHLLSEIQTLKSTNNELYNQLSNIENQNISINDMPYKNKYVRIYHNGMISIYTSNNGEDYKLIK